MRPVNKGESPYQFIKDYKDAQSFLENRIGIYCSYCEMPIINAPEVEHIVSKTNGGDKTKWENLLLGCKYCNSRKLSITTPIMQENIYGRIVIIRRLRIHTMVLYQKWRRKGC